MAFEKSNSGWFALSALLLYLAYKIEVVVPTTADTQFLSNRLRASVLKQASAHGPLSPVKKQMGVYL